MAELIKIVEDRTKPRIVCGHCGKEILIDIRPFADDVTQIMKDRCPKCHGEIYVGVMIMGHASLNNLLYSIKAAINAINSQNAIIGGKRNG